MRFYGWRNDACHSSLDDPHIGEDQLRRCLSKDQHDLNFLYERNDPIADGLRASIVYMWEEKTGKITSELARRDGEETGKAEKK